MAEFMPDCPEQPNHSSGGKRVKLGKLHQQPDDPGRGIELDAFLARAVVKELYQDLWA